MNANDNMYFESNRLLSFRKNPLRNIDVSEYVKSGFYLKTMPDVVECVFCKIEFSIITINFLKHHNCIEKVENKIKNIPLSNILNQYNVLPASCKDISKFWNMCYILIRNTEIYHTEYNSYDFRLDSFENRWPNTSICKKRLAKAGFFLSNERNGTTTCFSCNLKITSWKLYNNPLKVHIFKEPNCLYMNLLLNQLGTVIKNHEFHAFNSNCCYYCESEKIEKDIYLYPCKHLSFSCYGCALTIKKCLVCRNNITAIIKECFIENEQIITTIQINLLTIIHHGIYFLKRDRKSSFKTWPKVLNHLKDDLIESGFFYTKFSDYTTCFCCNLKMHDWNIEDNPFIVHSKLSPTCNYIQMVKGIQYVEKYISEIKNDDNEAIPITFEDLSCHEEFKEYNFIKCIACMDNNINVVCIPCGHAALCSECLLKSYKHKFCSICQEKVNFLLPIENEETDDKFCKKCHVNEVENISIPCRHIGLCQNCAIKEKNCFVCNEIILFNIKVFFSC
ncbi:putative inhibitor of apoptosis [Leptopilina boulardi filamentous virus]|uniref:Putative inhibitor of apoptosis n=1 Tax=Leptopilina boulardi filamentous virus TaxID=552509 RepID=A0A1S5YDA9_9VIRU|nr:putative inhibitor of apoptosis [Leptopilina boulardi filamentous virus]AQQ79986.1 putative inhibitor of apoptosis [Leptopilina boulardi filamentous virus]